MDPICEQKYNFLQKYVPFLANLIELLANDNEKKGKLAQMQLLYDLLNKPDNSVKIETLEKCEEVLSRVFGHNEKISEDDFVMPNPFIKAELPEEPEDGSEGKNWENSNGSFEHKCDEPSTTPIDESNTQNIKITPEEGIQNLKPEQKYDSEAESSKCEYVNKNYNEKDIMMGREKEENVFREECDEADGKKKAEDENKPNLSIEVQNTETANDVNVENEEKLIIEQKVKHEIENNLKIRTEPKDDKSKIVEKNENEITKVPKLDKHKDKENHVSNDEINESDCSSANVNHSVHSESEKCSPCATQVVNCDEESLQTNDKQLLHVPDEKKFAENCNNENISIPNESNTSSPCVQKIVTVESDSISEENPQPEEQEVEKIIEGVKEIPEEETTIQDNEQAVNQNKSCKSDTPDQIKQKIETSEKIQNISVDGDLTPEKENKNILIRQSPTEMLRFKIVSAESLASTDIDTDKKVGPEVTNSPQTELSDTSKEIKTPADSDPLDPLSQTPEKKIESNKTSINDSTSSQSSKRDEDDDDVLLVENRSSPICIDSDPDDEEKKEEARKGNCSLPIIPTKSLIPKKKPILRKSTTLVMESIRNIINKNQHNTHKRKDSTQQNQKALREVGFVKKDPKSLMETIDLLDSDSEDELPKRKQLKTNKNTDDDVIIVSSTQPRRKFLTKKLNYTASAPHQIPRHYSKLINKSPAKPATAQSNFLNAVNLQPAKSHSANPATFSARLSNKKVIIPNAFYGNPSYNRKSSLSSVQCRTSDAKAEHSSNEPKVVPPTRAVGVYSGVSIRHVQDKVLKEWLDGFLTNFASPLQIASHACFVLLQRVLKYRFFQRLKETRIYLNQAAKNCSTESVDVQMLLDLRNVFLENDYLTEAGRRFCRFATNDAFGKPVALTTDSKTGRVTCRTRVASKGDLPTDISKITNSSFNRNTKPITPDKPPNQFPIATTAASVAFNLKPAISSSKTSQLNNTSTPLSVSKRRGKFRKLSDGLVVAEKDEDDNDYTPAHNEIEPEAEIVTERKRSLRTNRTKRKEAGFTYSEDHDDEEFEAIARKIENKKREELRLAEERELELEREQLEHQRKTTKKTVAKKTTAKRNGGQIDNPKGTTRKKLRLANTSIVGSEDNDLLTPTWIEADCEEGEVDSLLDFVDDPESPDLGSNPAFESNNTCDSLIHIDETTEETSQDSLDIFDTHTNKSLKNIDRNLHLHSKTYDLCVHCQKKFPRIVHHYVNEHRSSEVFPSRLRNRDIRRLLTTSNVGFVHLYKGNQIQYAAHCIFCDKEAKFLLPYWFEHFTMHTGEYSFKCSGCHILKPTRSLLTNHITSNTGCPKKGSAIRLVNFDTKVHQIEAHICSICNYVQLHRKNLVRHLRTQHGLDTISLDNILKVVLLQISAPSSDQDAINKEESQLALIQNSDDEDQGINNVSLDENSLMMQHDFTDNDDLSFMICGMLDVQTNLSPTG